MEEKRARSRVPPERSHVSQALCLNWLWAGWAWHCVWEELREETIIHSFNKYPLSTVPTRSWPMEIGRPSHAVCLCFHQVYAAC